MSHPLKIYRARHDLSLDGMAALVRISPSTLSRIENDKMRCSGVIAIAIEAKTNGEVTFEELNPVESSAALARAPSEATP